MSILSLTTGSCLIVVSFETSNCQQWIKQQQTIFSTLTSSAPRVKWRLHLKCPHTPVPVSLTVNFYLYRCWGPTVSVSLTLDVNAGLFLQHFKMYSLRLEIFGTVFVASRICFANIDKVVIMATSVVHCSKRNKTFPRRE